MRYRLLRCKRRHLQKRIWRRAHVELFKVRSQVHLRGRSALSFSSKWIASAAGLLLAALFALTLPESLVTSAALKSSEVHVAGAGIIGTALALVLSLSIIPAQKAADVFSSAILKLYARDWVSLSVFSLLSFAALASLLLGSGWTLWLSPRYALAGQLVLLAVSLDALRAFYRRALDLLDPATALKLVANECNRYIRLARSESEWLVRIQRAELGDEANDGVIRYTYFSKSKLSDLLTVWTKQLEEFARKAVLRRDTQAVNAVVRTMAEIGRGYAEARRDSMLLSTDWSAGMPLGVSDISEVLSPIYESIRVICEDAAKHPNEAVVQGCIATLGDMAAHAMTMVHSSDKRKSAPLVYDPVFYIDLCVKAAIAAGMEDALLGAVSAARKVFICISKDVDSQAGEQQAIEILISVALASYPRRSMVLCFRSVEMLLLAAHHDIRVRGYRDFDSLLSKVLPSLAALVPLEVEMEKAGQRRMHTFPAYSPSFEANLPGLLTEVARQVKSVDDIRSWVSPFNEFEEASEAIVDHYRDLAKSVNFGGVLLEKWVVDSLLRAAEVYVPLLDHPSPGTDEFLEEVDVRLRWFIHAPSSFFQEQADFPYRHASDACDHLAVLGMALLRCNRLESAEACGQAVRSIAHRCAKAQGTSNYTSAYGFADCVIKLELLARAADSYGRSVSAAKFRAFSSRPDGIPDEKWTDYAEAVANRTRRMENELTRPVSGHTIGPNPVTELRNIVGQRHGSPA